MKNLSKEQLATEIASQIKEMGMNTVFNEEFIDQVRKTVSEKINTPVLEEEVDTEESAAVQEDVEDGGVVDSLPGGGEDPNNTDFSTEANVEGYTPQMPSFLDKIEPDQFVVFDMNELSEGGVNLSNKQFRTFDNPDIRRSIHQCWIEEGKRKAKVYVAKFEEIGDISFDPLAGTSKFEEKRINNISIPGEKQNPYADGSANLQVTGSNSAGPITMDLSSINIEGMMKKYIEDALRAQLNTSFQMQAPETETPTPEMPMQESPKKTEENLIIADNAQDAMGRNSVKTEISEAEENEIKMVELAMNERAYRKVDAPKGLVESLSDPKNVDSLLVSKGKEVQELKFEGVSYFYPVNIISSNKCYVKR